MYLQLFRRGIPLIYTVNRALSARSRPFDSNPESGVRIKNDPFENTGRPGVARKIHNILYGLYRGIILPVAGTGHLCL